MTYIDYRHRVELGEDDYRAIDAHARQRGIAWFASLVSFPFTVVHTLPLVLRGTASTLLVYDIADDWYTRRAPLECDRFLGHVSTTARDAHGLLSVGC